MRRGAALLVAAAALAASLAGCADGGITVTAVFDDVGDLQARHGVQVADVRVGRIAGIELTEDFRARVTMRLHDGVRVPTQSIAVLRTTSLLGEKFVELRPTGAPDAGPFLADGDTLARTQEAPELEFVADEVTAVLGAVAADDLATVIRTGAEGFGGRGDELGHLLRDLSTISRTLAERSGTLTAVIDNLDRAASTLAAGREDVGALLVNLAATSQVLADNRDRAVRALDALSRLAESQNAILDRYRTDIDRQIKQVDAIVSTAAGHVQEVGALLEWLNRFVLVLPDVVPGEFAQIWMWAIPHEQEADHPPPGPEP